MSANQIKANKPANDPAVVLNLRKTEYGYEIIPEKGSHTISLTKSMLSKTGKKTAESKENLSKSTQKSTQPSTQSLPQKSTPVSKSKATTKTSPNAAKNVAPTQSATKEKPSPMIIEPEMKRKEIFPFTEFSFGPEGEVDVQDNVAPVELNIPADPSKLDKASEGQPGQTASTSKPSDKTKKKYPLVIPSSAHWFKLQEIHSIEKEELPEFFQGKPSKTPEIYKKYRNYIINLYRQSPRIYLSSTRCRKNLGGDACAIMRIHNFLERWGLINFSVRRRTLPDRAVEKLADQLYGISKYEEKLDLFDQERKIVSKSNENDNSYNQIKILTKKLRPLCDFCGLICGLVWYQQKTPEQYQPVQEVQNNQESEPLASIENLPQNQPSTAPIQVKKTKRLDLCIKCYSDGNIPNILAPADFNKVDILTKLSSSVDNENVKPWSEEEDLKLLNLIQKHGDEWEQIQKGFSNRSQEEIILHYFKLPLDNTSTINLPETQKKISNEEDANKMTLDTVSPSFSEYSNPILRHVAIFRSLLDKYKEKLGLQKESENKDQIKSEQDNKGKSASEIIKAQDESEVKKEGTMEIEEQKPTKEKASATKGKEEKKSLKKESTKKKVVEEKKEAVVAQPEVDLERIEKEKANLEKELYEAKIKSICNFDDSYSDPVAQLAYDTKHRAKVLMEKEEEKIKEAANFLVDLQINKLEAKLAFLEEYERILQQERRNQEIFQKMMIAERVCLAHKGLELVRQDQSQMRHNYETRDPTTMLNLNSNLSNINVDDMISLGNNNDKIDEYTKDSF